MAILVGGKPVTSKKAVQRVGKHRQLTMEQIKHRHPADPFPSIDEFQKDSVDHRISVSEDLRMWAEQRLTELEPIASDENWLRLQLREPDLQDHPDRPAAKKRLESMQLELAELAGDVAYLEAHADRIWQSLPIEDREDLAKRWIADVEDERLILNSWTRIAQVGFRWPDYYRVDMRWFHHLSPVLIQDMKDAWPEEGVLLGKRHEWDTPPESIDYLPEDKSTFS